MNKNQQQIFEIVFFSTVAALLLVLQITGLAFPAIVLGGLVLGPTTLHIPVIIGGIILKRKYAWALGLTFGLMSFWQSFTAVHPISRLFQNPLVSIFPRIAFGYASFEIYKLLNKTRLNKKVVVMISAGLATLVHTILVISTLSIFGGLTAEVEGSVFDILLGLLTINMIAEIVLAILIVSPIVIAIKEVRSDEEVL